MKKILLFIKFMLPLIVGCTFIWGSIYYLPFHPWTLGMVRPWFILQDLIPYRDFVWIRMPADLYILAGWYKIFGVTPQTYQAFVALISLATVTIMYFATAALLPKARSFPYWIFVVFSPILFSNTEIGELIVGLLALVAISAVLRFSKTKSPVSLAVAGCACGLMLVTKQTTIIFVILISIWTYRSRQIHYPSRKNIWPIVYLGSLSLFPTLLTMYFLITKTFGDFLYYTFVFLLESYYRAPVTHGDGMRMALGILMPILVYGLIRSLSKKITKQELFLIIAPITLSIMLLPSYLSYRAYPMFVIAVLSAGILIAPTSPVKRISMYTAGAVIISVIALLPYIQSFRIFVSDNGFSKNQMLMDYGQAEYEIANWINTNTDSDTKILNYGNPIINLLSDKLPVNKYVDPFPYLLVPYDETIPAFTDHLPEIVVFDENLPNDHEGLSSWPFLRILSDSYEEQYRVNDTVVVYSLSNHLQ